MGLARLIIIPSSQPACAEEVGDPAPSCYDPGEALLDQVQELRQRAQEDTLDKQEGEAGGAGGVQGSVIGLSEARECVSQLKAGVVSL